jgi:hypothetical protein
MIRSTYNAFMDPNSNPLRNLPPAQRFQITAYLGLMWTILFCAAGGLGFWYGELVIAHMLLAGGALITGWVFEVANRATRSAVSPATYRDYRNSDGTSRYDDVWGG